MKTYEKPTFDVVALTANSSFCVCDMGPSDPMWGWINNGGATFSLSDECKGDGLVDDYCKNSFATILISS